MKWAGNMVRMKDERLIKLSETKKQGGCRKLGRSQLRWKDCMKRDPRKAEEEEKWREKPDNREQLKQIKKVAVQIISLIATKGKREEEQTVHQTVINHDTDLCS